MRRKGGKKRGLFASSGKGQLSVCLPTLFPSAAGQGRWLGRAGGSALSAA